MPLNDSNVMAIAHRLFLFTIDAANFSDKMDIIFIAEMFEKFGRFVEKYKDVSVYVDIFSLRGRTAGFSLSNCSCALQPLEVLWKLLFPLAEESPAPGMCFYSCRRLCFSAGRSDGELGQQPDAGRRQSAVDGAAWSLGVFSHRCLPAEDRRLPPSDGAGLFLGRLSSRPFSDHLLSSMRSF